MRTLAKTRSLKAVHTNNYYRVIKNRFSIKPIFYWIKRKVRLILGSIFLFVLGNWCCQKCWVDPRIKSRLPAVNSILCFRDLSFLWRRWNIRLWPNDNEAIAGFFPSSFSSSACQPLLSCPSLYKFNKQELNCSLQSISTFDFISINTSVKGIGCITILE